ncbi:ABC transporter permease [Actinomadura verrucosospora]|uniref:Putative ABC transporter transmembrane protein n=1 Tax=Actinomadura verrucosospora TaxID=46165 RepID=A0A7D4AGH1_ACTVE|nr:ABC transporter permease [Actinomadura verrucosospora]QKG18648.1 putative ABC transporter transmembrane protein [Actinomadura verrucosospora]
MSEQRPLRPSAATVIAASARAGFEEFTETFQIRLWLTGWVVRLAFQVMFFSLVGKYVEGQRLVDFMLIGNVLGVIALEGSAIAPAAATERYFGVLGMLVGTPGNHVLCVLARPTMRIAMATCSSTVVFLVLTSVLDVAVPWPAGLCILPVLVVVSLTCYCYGCFVSAMVYRFAFLEPGAVNIAYLSVIVFAGVNVPVSFWPAPVRVLSDCLPITHGLHAVRTIVARGPWSSVIGQVLLELLVGAAWLAVAYLLLARWIDRDRRAGRLDLG